MPVAIDVEHTWSPNRYVNVLPVTGMPRMCVWATRGTSKKKLTNKGKIRPYLYKIIGSRVQLQYTNNHIHVTKLAYSLACQVPDQTWSPYFKMWCQGVPLIHTNVLVEHAASIFGVEEWARCFFYPEDWCGSFLQNTDTYLPNYIASHPWSDLTSLPLYLRSWWKISSTVQVNVKIL
jgi:hypothetical protein